MTLDRREQRKAEPDPPPDTQPEDLLNRNIGRRYETPRRYETRVELGRSADGHRRANRD